jgi:hypothetical protein
MEIAIQQQEKGVKIYLEGILWTAITEYFQEERVNIYQLVFLIDDEFISHDNRFELTDDQLRFCKQSITVKELLSRLKEMDLSYPNDVKIGNKDFFIQQLFPDSYVLTFWDKVYADKFITSISEKYLSGIKVSLIGHKEVTTKRLNHDFETSPNFDRFLDKRIDKWNASIVKEVQDGIENGSIIPVKYPEES